MRHLKLCLTVLLFTTPILTSMCCEAYLVDLLNNGGSFAVENFPVHTKQY